MAHLLNTKNGKASMFYYGETPWHKLGQRLEKPATSAEAISAAQLDYTVTKFPLEAMLPGIAGKGSRVDVPDHFATVRTDTNDVLGVVGSRYEVVQNTEAFSFFDGLVGSGEAMYHTAGALGKGERIWILAKLPDYIKLRGKDIVEKFLLLSTGHDGRTKLTVKMTPIRVVCNNTLSVALSGSEQSVNIMHNGEAHDNLQTAHKILGLTNQLYDQLAGIFNKMSLKKVTDKQLLEYVKNLIPDVKDGSNTRRESQRERILELAEVGQGADLARGTLWGGYNAVTEFADHIGGEKANDMERLNSMWFGGSKEVFKQRAFDVAVSILNQN